MLMNNIIEFGL